MSTNERPVALITGASRGIGAATARELARQGYALALAARSAESLEQLAAELSASGAQVVTVPTDLCQPDQVERLAHRVLGHFGHVDVLVNNAGVGAGDIFIRYEKGQIDEQMATNLSAPIELTRLLLPGMVARRRGAIIFIASVSGMVALPTSTIYSATKFGLRGFAMALRREVAGHGIGVTIVSPGYIDTAMTAKVKGVPKAPPEQVARAIVKAITHPRREVIVPGAYRIFVWLDRALPGVVDMVMRSGKSRRSRQ